MEYQKLMDNAKIGVMDHKSQKRAWRLCWNSAKREGYGTIKEKTAADNIVQKNNILQVDVLLKQHKKNSSEQQHQSSENLKALEQIQNALFVTRVSKKFQTSFLENESAHFTTTPPTTTTVESEVIAKSPARGIGNAAVSSCQRIRCKKLVRRIKKVLGETLKRSSEQSTTPRSEKEPEEEVEDIYVEVNQLACSSTSIYSYLEKGDANMQNMRSRFESSFSSTSSSGSKPIPRPAHLYSNAIHNQNLINNNNSLVTSQNFINNNHKTAVGGNLSKSVDNCWTVSNRRFCNGNVVAGAATSSSEEDNSPTEMNSCRKFIDKPPLVKRLTMALLLKTSEDSRPLMCNSQNSNLNNYKTSENLSYSKCNNSSSATTSPGKCTSNYDGYVNEGICDLEQIISSKFGDSCRKSLMSMGNHHENMNWSIEHLNNQEFNFKKNLLRETSSANSSPKIFSKPFRGAQHMNFAEQQELKDAPWFQAGIPRDISLEVLSKQTPGAFLVRQSSTKPGCFVLSLRVSPPLPKVAHYLILKTSRGYKIKGFTKEFTSLRALITHHSVMPELLPVPLALPRPKNIPARRNVNDFDTYESLSDFQKLMTDLNDNLKLSTLVL